MRTVAAIAWNTLLEGLSSSAALVFVSLFYVLLGLIPNVSGFALDEELRLVGDSVLSACFSAGIFIAALCATATSCAENETGTALLVLSKPVTRTEFVLGKFFGAVMGAGIFLFVLLSSGVWALKIAAAGTAANLEEGHAHEHGEVHGLFPDDVLLSAVYYGLPAVCFCIGAVVNYWKGLNFSRAAALMLALGSAAGAFMFWVRAPEPFGRTGFVLVRSGFLIGLAVCMMTAISTALAQRLKFLPALAGSAAFFGVGLIAEYLFRDSVPWVRTMVFSLVPNWQNFWAGGLAEGAAAKSPLLVATAYAVCYSGFVLVWAVVFRRAKKTE